MIKKELMTHRSTPDSAAPNPVNEENHSRQTKTDHPLWTRYWIGPARFMATPINQLIITNISCWVFKQAGKLNAEHKGRRLPGDSDDEEAHQSNTGGQKQFPPKVKTGNMLYMTHNSTGEQEKHSLQAKDHTTTISAEVQSGLIKPHTLSAIKPPVSIQQDRLISELD